MTPDTEKEISCRLTKTLLLYVKEKNNGCVHELLDGISLSEEYLSDTNNWISHNLLQTLYHRMTLILGDKNAVYHMAMASTRFQSLGILDRILSLMWSPKQVYSQAPRYMRFLRLVGSINIHELTDSSVILEDKYHQGMTKTRYDCDCTRGILTVIPILFGRPMAHVEEIKCQVDEKDYGIRAWPDRPVHGSTSCVYKVLWSPGKKSLIRRLFSRKNSPKQAIEDLMQANQTIQSKYDEVTRLLETLERKNRQLSESKVRLEKQQKALIESENRYRMLAENATDTIWTLDVKTLRLNYVSPSVTRSWGYTPDEIARMDLREIVSPKSFRFISKLLAPELKGRQGSHHCLKHSRILEIEVAVKTGGYRYGEVTATFIRDDDGFPKSVIGVTRDITERKKMAALMVQTEKMMSVGGLAAGMAHEINNPLAGMMQNAQVIRNRLTKDIPGNTSVADALEISMETIRSYTREREIDQLLEHINGAGNRAAKIIDNMLNFSRNSDAQKKMCCLDELIDQTIDLAKNDYDLKKKYDFKNIKIVHEYEPDIPAVPCEKSKIQQVILNIMKNAAEAMLMENDSRISPRLVVRLKDKNKYIRIEIEDNGPGMDHETQKRIFEPFYTLKGPDKGTGLGLSISYFIIVDNHKGKIEVNSIPGQGSCFIIKLPAA